MFSGFSDRAFELMLASVGDPAPAKLEAQRIEQERYVRGPVIELCRELEPEFGPAYVYRLHKPPIFWKRQMAVISVARDTGYALELTFDGLITSAGWWRGRPGYVERFRRALDDPLIGGRLVHVLERLDTLGWSLEGDRLKRVPRPYPQEHARAEFLRYRSLYARQDFGIPGWLQRVEAIDHVRQALRETRPLVDWLSEAICDSARRVQHRVSEAWAWSAPCRR